MNRRDALMGLLEAAIGAATPALILPPHLPPAPDHGRILLLATGKAGASMAAAAEAHYLSAGVAPDRIGGLAVCRHGYGAPTRRVDVVEAGHPTPDAAGLAATGRVIDIARAAGPDDLVIALLSGGGSANWVAPVAGVTLDDKRALTRALQRAGAPIDALNCVRKHLSRLKGGRLAALARPARLVTLAISDVPGDDPSVIASGPTVPDPTTLADARAVLAAHGVTPPPSIAAALADPANETPKPGDPAFADAPFHIVATPALALAAAERAARALGLRVISLGADLEGEARAVAAAHAALVREARASGVPTAILSGGELTVTVTGPGRGGPNQEYALALAIALNGMPGVHALAADTDGTDGGGGDPGDPAGATIDSSTLARAAALGLDPASLLAENDATGFFEALGDLVDTGPTLTNVNDLRVILVEP